MPNENVHKLISISWQLTT